MTESKITVPPKSIFEACYRREMNKADPHVGENTYRFLMNESPLPLTDNEEPAQRLSGLIKLNAEMAFSGYQEELVKGGAPKSLIVVTNMSKNQICAKMVTAMMKCVTPVSEANK